MRATRIKKVLNYFSGTIAYSSQLNLYWRCTSEILVIVNSHLSVSFSVFVFVIVFRIKIN